jgi:tRNA G18 (ribose-2'-O)-methylase SpoU
MDSKYDEFMEEQEENELAGVDLNDSDEDPELPDRLIRAETILNMRTQRIALVLDMLSDEANQQAILRTAESFGVQCIYTVEATSRKNIQERSVQVPLMFLFSIQISYSY